MLRLRLELHYKNRPKPQRIPVDAFPFTIGRSRANDLVVSAPSVSSRHVRLDADGDDSLLLTDQGSTNGTFIDGDRITARKPVAIEPPLTLLIGKLPITITYHPGTQPSFEQVLADKNCGEEDSSPPPPDDLPEEESTAPPSDALPQPQTVQEANPPEASLGGVERLLLTFSIFTLIAGVAFFILFFF